MPETPVACSVCARAQGRALDSLQSPTGELATFEVHLGEQMVFGIDDWLPQVRTPAPAE